jgi:hypothetical protein
VSVAWECVDNEAHIYAALLGSDVVRVEFDGRPDACCLEVAATAARLAQLEAGGHRVKEISIGAAPIADFDRLGASDWLASARHDLTVRITRAEKGLD